jgi:glycosyltransferase involved in cell wall biosynthesis
VPRILHVLPHRGGGAERYISLLEGLRGSEHARFALSGGRSPASALRSLPVSYPRLLRARRGADLLHIHGDTACLLTLPLVVRQPSVWTTHGLHLLRRHPSVAPGIRGALASTRATICTSHAEADQLAELAPAWRDRLGVVHNGVELPPPADARSRAQARAELGLAPEDVVALFMGELEERKAPLDAVAAATAARAGDSRIVLLLAGRGPLAGAIAPYAGDAIRPLGFCEDTLRLTAAADIFLAPSKREGLSFALLEAMAHGLAVVVADGPGNPEAVGEAGVVVATGDREAFTRALIELAQDKARRAALGTAARERVAREFAVPDMLAGVEAVYEDALRAPGQGGGDAFASARSV